MTNDFYDICFCAMLISGKYKLNLGTFHVQYYFFVCYTIILVFFKENVV